MTITVTVPIFTLNISKLGIEKFQNFQKRFNSQKRFSLILQQGNSIVYIQVTIFVRIVTYQAIKKIIISKLREGPEG